MSTTNRPRVRAKIAALTQQNQQLRTNLAASLKTLLSSGETLLVVAAALKRHVAQHSKEAA